MKGSSNNGVIMEISVYYPNSTTLGFHCAIIDRLDPTVGSTEAKVRT